MEEFLQYLKELDINFMDFFDAYYEFKNLPEDIQIELIKEYTLKLM